ncbi:SH3 domain-containing protein, partial [Klebsiella pneumoniae]|uniref:SH3 domain-containing protein n=2 Tax=Bacteria TaxID=2 RepID=UPI001330D98E
VGTLALSLGHSSVSAQEKGTVTVSALNIRNGPGTDTSIKGCLQKGDEVAILEKSDGWLNVQLPNKGTGWVS